MKTKEEKLAHVRSWQGVWKKQAKDTRVAIANGVPSHWQSKKTAEDYQLDCRIYEFAAFGLDQLIKAIENGDV